MCSQQPFSSHLVQNKCDSVKCNRSCSGLHRLPLSKDLWENYLPQPAGEERVKEKKWKKVSERKEWIPLGRDSLVASYLMCLWRIQWSSRCAVAGSERESQSFPHVSQPYGRHDNVTVKMSYGRGGMVLWGTADGRAWSMPRVTLPKPCGIYTVHNWVEGITEYFICVVGIRFLRV